ncbi:hypothetical protein SDRG_09665 [Saprolegnia diclina VS20]|uniref:Tudor domain-containing protein n=1 Tax=Saprolegnia diclina (strain VS20) TaxID=1156394 RepID=T0QD69_SAPDV|nr:hypothetical protein SDRG_09665 [Saprolegnia diclina VS20]EQC32691.1 hypothetical protein SDRG_09665 [Saprolegnia diclina VS20]|eukprot:XP_008613835.1 hypothetical protein SDRG_09665 [Saprolegnia diclina VS20]
MSTVHDTGGLVGIKVLVPHAGDVVAYDAKEQRYEVRFVTGLVMNLPRDEVLNLNRMSMLMPTTPVVHHPLVGTFVVKLFGSTLVRGVVQQHISEWNVFEVAYDNGLREHVSEDYIRANPYEPVVVKVEPPDDCIDLTLSDDETPIKTEHPPRLPPSLAPVDELPPAPAAYKPPPATPVASVALAAPATATAMPPVASPAPATDVALPEHSIVEWSASESDVSPPHKQFTRLTKAKPRRLNKAGRTLPLPPPALSESESPRTRDASSSEDENTSEQGASSSSDDEKTRDPRAVKDELAAKVLRPVDKNRRHHCHVRHKKDRRSTKAASTFLETKSEDTARRPKMAKRAEYTPPSSPVLKPKRLKKTPNVPELTRPRSNVRQLKSRTPNASPKASTPRDHVAPPLVSPRDMDTEFVIPRKQASSKPTPSQNERPHSNSKYTAAIFNPPNAINRRPTQRPTDRARLDTPTLSNTRSMSPRSRRQKIKPPVMLPAGWDAPPSRTATVLGKNQPAAIPRPTVPIMSKPVSNLAAKARIVAKGLMPDYMLKNAAVAAERLKNAQLESASSGGYVPLGRKHQLSTKLIQRRPSKDDVTTAVPTTPPEEPQRYLAREPRPTDEFSVSV